MLLIYVITNKNVRFIPPLSSNKDRMDWQFWFYVTFYGKITFIWHCEKHYKVHFSKKLKGVSDVQRFQC